MDDTMSKEKAADLLDNLVGMVDDSQDNDYDTALRMGINALTADTVKVVRCKDCIYYRDYGCQRAFVYPKPDDFCSYGDRKCGEQNDIR